MSSSSRELQPYDLLLCRAEQGQFVTASIMWLGSSSDARSSSIKFFFSPVSLCTRVFVIYMLRSIKICYFYTKPSYSHVFKLANV